MSQLIVPDCYDHIIGLSRTNCECYDIPAEAEESLSGLYLDELESLAIINSIKDCENNNDTFAMMDRARQIAITNFQGDTNALMMDSFKLRRNNYSGAIGRAVYKGSVAQTTGQFYGVRIFCNNIKSGVMVIKNIGTMFEQTGTIDLQIWNNLGDLIDHVMLDTEALKHHKNKVSIELPLHDKYIENLEYFFVYQSGANKALNNDLKCNCGGFKPYFDKEKPYFHQLQQDRNYWWSNWVMAGTYHVDTLPDFNIYNSSRTCGNQMQGLTFEVELKCKISEVLCYESLDFESNNLAIAMAVAIQNKAASIMGNWIVNTANLNRFTMINGEQMLENIKAWDKVYIDMVKYIASEADITVNDCLACKDIFEMAKRGILA